MWNMYFFKLLNILYLRGCIFCNKVDLKFYGYLFRIGWYKINRNIIYKVF